MAANFYQNSTAVGLGLVATAKVPEAGSYFAEGKMSIPSIPAGSLTASSVVVVVNLNGSPVYTGLAGSKGFHAQIPCAANDTITVVLSSAAAVDQELNAIKSSISIGLGE